MITNWGIARKIITDKGGYLPAMKYRYMTRKSVIKRDVIGEIITGAKLSGNALIFKRLSDGKSKACFLVVSYCMTIRCMLF